MAMDCTNIDSGVVCDIAVRDTNRLVGSVARALAANSPFIGILAGGTFRSGIGDTVVSAVEMQAAPGDSLAVPTFIDQTLLCGTRGTQEKTGKVEFSYKLQGKRGQGPKVCVKEGFGAFKTSYQTAEDALRKLITQYINADVQAQLVLKSATKASAIAGGTIPSNTVGGTENDIDITWTGLALPNAALSFKALHAWARYLKEGLFGEMFSADGKAQPHFRAIGGSDIIESFRAEVGVENVLLALTTGGYKLGENSVSAYAFESSPAYRGIAFGTTHRPLRYNEVDGDGIPIFLNPVETVQESSEDCTAYAQPNPEWAAALYEILILVAEGTFERQVPEQYVGEGTFKYAPQLHAGELEWHYVKDNTCNQWGDFGWHNYQITRAYKPLRPQHIIPIAFKRDQVDLGLTEIVDASS